MTQSSEPPYYPHIEQGANVNNTDGGSTALTTAASNGHLKSVKHLVEHGADINLKDPKSGSTAIALATNQGHQHVVKYLLDQGAVINAESHVENSITTEVTIKDKSNSHVESQVSDPLPESIGNTGQVCQPQPVSIVNTKLELGQSVLSRVSWTCGFINPLGVTTVQLSTKLKLAFIE